MKHGTLNGYKYHRCRCDLCKKANRDYLRQLRGRQDERDGPPLYWPIQPLFEAAGTNQFGELSIRTRISKRTLHRSFERGLTDNTADRAAIGLGLHPITIWPHWIDPYLEGAA
jgi:hypothetical protein